MFKVNVKQSDLLSALRKIRNTVGKDKDEQKIFTRTIYMESFDDNGKLKLKMITSNTTDISEITIDAIGGEAGPCEALIDFDRFHEYVDTLGKYNDITLDNTNDINRVDVIYPGTKKPFNLTGLPKEKFIMPPVNPPVANFSVPYAVLKEGIDKLSGILHDNTLLQKYNCMKVIVNSSQVSFLGLDSTYSVPVLYVMSTGATADCEFLIECQKVKRLLSGFTTTKNAEVTLTNNNITFAQEGLVITTRLYSYDDYPDVLGLFPQKYKLQLEFAKEDMLLALNRVECVTDGESANINCTLVIDENTIEVSAKSKHGETVEEVSANLNLRPAPPKDPSTPPALPFTIVFKVEGLKQILNSISSDRVTMSFNKRTIAILSPVGLNVDHRCHITRSQAS